MEKIIMVLNFVSDLAQVGEVRYLAFCNIVAVNKSPPRFSFELFVLS